ncbi:hypothetical protein VLK31_32070 [Variovorax sp. H27-G14]
MTRDTTAWKRALPRRLRRACIWLRRNWTVASRSRIGIFHAK